jgi:hypothetical protein
MARLSCCIDGTKASFQSLVHEVCCLVLLPCCTVYKSRNCCIGIGLAIFRTCSLADSVLLQRDVKKARRTPTAINRLPQFRSTVPSLDYKAECHYLMRANYLMIIVLIDEVEGSMGRETTSHHSGSMSRRGTVTPPRLKKLRCLRM